MLAKLPIVIVLAGVLTLFSSLGATPDYELQPLEYSKAKDDVFQHTDIKQSPWYVVHADTKRRARLNCIHHLLSLLPYKDLTPPPVKLPPRKKEEGYVSPPLEDQAFVPDVY